MAGVVVGSHLAMKYQADLSRLFSILRKKTKGSHYA
jgi:hypothetical protein